ncbi:MAG: DUF927 domain-containing protein [Mogibacterium sp.]|nr:DUF927 domain-containing protein [Mogibacterium sp.]
MNNNEITTTFSLSDFADGTVFDELGLRDRTVSEREVLLVQLKREAKELGLGAKAFNAIVSDYLRGEAVSSVGSIAGYDMPTRWVLTSTGEIQKTTMELACSHPIYISKRFIDCLTGEIKLEITYSRDSELERLQSFIVPKSRITSSQSIVALANKGVSVSSTNAALLVNYLQDFEDTNYDQIVEIKSINRFGWIGKDFSPYVDGIEFDADDNYSELEQCVTKPNGTIEDWEEVVKTVRKSSKIAPKVALAASFASVLIEPLDALPFFVHFWGASGGGKTVSLMLAASVWGKPDVGSYIKTFNSTKVAQEILASTLYSMPVICDELQIKAGASDNFDSLIYELCEGSGKSRSNKQLGIQASRNWRNCFISSGEQPITGELSGGGAKNRVFEIECQDDLFSEPMKIVEAVKSNYGHAGREFVEALDTKTRKKIKSAQQSVFAEYSEKGFTDKQALAASIVVVAEAFYSTIILNEPPSFDAEDLEPYIATHDDVSQDLRAVEWLKGWIVKNWNKFDEDAPEIYGVANTSETVDIVAPVLREHCQKAGINYKKLVSYLDRLKVLDTNKGRKDKRVRIGATSPRCISVKKTFLHKEEDE